MLKAIQSSNPDGPFWTLNTSLGDDIRSVRRLAGGSRDSTTANSQSGREETGRETNQPSASDLAAMVVDPFAMIDKFGGDFEELIDSMPDMAMAATRELEGIDPTKLKPTEYKDVFEAPKNFQEAWNPEPFKRNKWRAGIGKEFGKMTSNRVWKKIKRSMMPKNRKCVKYKWVFEWKRDGTARARLVACGYSQIAGVDFTEVFSPVANDISFRIVLIYMLTYDLDACIFDIETAFLNGDLEEEIYKDCPEGMEHEDDECLLLLKTIYGLVQSARQYFKKFKSVLVGKMGFKQCPSDPCLFMRKNELGIVLIICHVDDNFTVGSKAAMKQALDEIKANGLNLTVTDELNDYLSCMIKISKDRKKAWIGQPHMVKKIRKEFGQEVAKLQRYRTPGTPGQGLVTAKSEEDKVPIEQHKRYRTGLGMLLYMIKHSRPDMANSVRELTKCVDGSTPAAYKEMLRNIKFLLDTEGKGLKIEALDLDELAEWVLILYSDSDWAGDKDTRKSVTGYMLFLNGVLICWRSRGQKAVALSSSEAEFYACSEAVKEIPFVLQILLFLEIPVKLPVEVYVDNIGAIFMIENNNSSSRTRHMDTRFRYVESLQDDGLIKVNFVRTEKNKADVETKNVSGDILDTHMEDCIADVQDMGMVAYL